MSRRIVAIAAGILALIVAAAGAVWILTRPAGETDTAAGPSGTPVERPSQATSAPGDSSDPAPETRPQPDEGEPARSQQPVRQQLALSGKPLSGSYVAMSNTAMSITGDISLKADVISFDRGQTVTTVPMYRVGAGKAYSTAGRTWSELLFVPETSQIELREITGVALNEGARGFCGESELRWAALGTERADKGIDVVSLALFSGETVPGPDAPEGNLCGTYSFSRG